MFTGIIEAMANVKEITDSSLTLERPALFDDIKIGSSVCISGACLSVVGLDGTSIIFNVVQETLNCSKLGSLEVGDKVNLERSMKASDRFEGHVVQGHVEGVGDVVSVGATLTVTLPDSLIKQVIPKGSITIDGVSLTVASVEGNQIAIALIPHTLKNTTLGLLKAGDKVNIETDILVRHSQYISCTKI